MPFERLLPGIPGLMRAERGGHALNVREPRLYFDVDVDVDVDVDADADAGVVVVVDADFLLPFTQVLAQTF